MASLVSEVNTNSPFLAVRDSRSPRARIDDLGMKVILPDRRAVLGAPQIPGRRPGPSPPTGRRYRRRRCRRRVSISARMPSPQGSAPKMPTFKLTSSAGRALAPELIENGEHVARRHHDDVGREIADQLHLLFGLSARHRNDSAARRFGAVVRAQPAGKQSVAVGDVHFHSGAAARGPNRTRHEIAPRGDRRCVYSPPRWACRWCRKRREFARRLHGHAKKSRKDTPLANPLWS